MATKLMEIGNQRRPELSNVGVYRTKDDNQYNINHPYVQAQGVTDKYGKNPQGTGEEWLSVGDLNDRTARLGVNSAGSLLKNKYQKKSFGNEYDNDDVTYP